MARTKKTAIPSTGRSVLILRLYVFRDFHTNRTKACLHQCDTPRATTNRQALRLQSFHRQAMERTSEKNGCKGRDSRSRGSRSRGSRSRGCKIEADEKFEKRPEDCRCDERGNQRVSVVLQIVFETKGEESEDISLLSEVWSADPRDVLAHEKTVRFVGRDYVLFRFMKRRSSNTRTSHSVANQVVAYPSMFFLPVWRVINVLFLSK